MTRHLPRAAHARASGLSIVGRAAAVAALAAFASPTAARAQETVPPLPAPERFDGAVGNPAMAGGPARTDPGEALTLPAVEGSQPASFASAQAADAAHEAAAGAAPSLAQAGRAESAEASSNPPADSAPAIDALAGDPGAATSAGTTGAEAATAAVPSPASTAGGFGSDPWRSGALTAALLLVLAGAGATLVRLKNKGALDPVKGEKAMQVVGNLALGPKRRLLLVRVKGEEFVIASTEQGVTFLTGIGEERGLSALVGARPAQAQANETRQAALPRPGPARAAAGREEADSHEAAPRRAPATAQATSAEPIAPRPGAGSEILTSALRSLREKGLRKPGSADAAPARRAVETRDAPEAREILESRDARDARDAREPRDDKATQRAASSGAQPAGPQAGGAGGAAFPRYLANAFAEEGRRTLRSESTGDGASGPGEEIQVENVTNLIREKLREMKPLA